MILQALIMQFKPADVIALGTALTGLVIAMKKPKKITQKILSGLLIGIPIFYFLAVIITPDTDSLAGRNQTITTSGNNSPAMNVAATTYGSNSPITQNITFGQAALPRDTKEDIRSFLKKVNPQIVTMIDNGWPEIGVFLGAPSEVRLSDLSEREDFKKYLSFKKGTSLMTGGGNKMGNYLNEEGEEGLMTSFILYPKDSLRHN